MFNPVHAELFPEQQRGDSDILTWNDLDVVLAMLAETAPSWSADLNQTGPDESTIVVLPAGASDLIGPAFVLFRSGGRVQLDQFRWDEYRKIGGFGCLDDALAAMRARLVPLVARQEPDMGCGGELS